MNSLHNVAVLVVVVALLGSIGIGASLQQAFAQGVIVPQKEQFTKLTEQFQQDVLDLAAANPPTESDPPTSSDIDAIGIDDVYTLAKLFDNYKQETFRIFGAEPPDPDTEPPDPDTEPPDPDTEPPDPDTEPPDPDIDSPTR